MNLKYQEKELQTPIPSSHVAMIKFLTYFISLPKFWYQSKIFFWLEILWSKPVSCLLKFLKTKTQRTSKLNITKNVRSLFLFLNINKKKQKKFINEIHSKTFQQKHTQKKNKLRRFFFFICLFIYAFMLWIFIKENWV